MFILRRFEPTLYFLFNFIAVYFRGMVYSLYD